MRPNVPKLKGKLLTNHPLANYTSWKIGGPAEYFYQPTDLEDLVELLQGWLEEPITILGAATNVLVRDQGIPGLVIYLRHNLNQLQPLANGNLWVEAGVGLMQLVQTCGELGMLDGAFMAGIPGTLGGALKMNAGAYGDSIWHYVDKVATINRQGKISQREVGEFKVDYRKTSGLANNEWFIAAELKFARQDVAQTNQLIKTYLQKRAASQPLNLPNCGSVFRNPTGDYAARLIEASGLKGKQIGGARVSEKHANFIVNCGEAKACEVETLMQEIITTVEQASGIRLTPEVHILGKS